MSRAFRRICKLLPTLSKKELEQVRKRITFWGEPSHDKPVTPSHESPSYDWLLEGMEVELRRRGLLGLKSRLPMDRINPDWKTVSEEMRETLLIQLHRDPAGRAIRNAEVALGRLAARSLAMYLEQGRIPISPRTMLLNGDKVLLALDSQFPGYMAGGLLHCCLNPVLIGEL